MALSKSLTERLNITNSEEIIVHLHWEIIEKTILIEINRFFLLNVFFAFHIWRWIKMGVALYDASTQPVINLLFIQMCQYYVLKNRVSIKVVLSLHHYKKIEIIKYSDFKIQSRKWGTWLSLCKTLVHFWHKQRRLLKIPV
jgi:hypothetical protein